MTPDTFYTASPGWGWFIVLYFFIGGLAGGAFIASAMLDLAGREADQALVRRGYALALVGVVVSVILLTIDLGRPLRFWHMVIESHTGRPMFKPWSPMSVGVWILTTFGGFSLLAYVLSSNVGRRPLRMAVAIGGAIAGFGLAGYTGVLLAVTNRPVWADSPWLGVLFLTSGASTGLATLVLLGSRVAHQGTLEWLARFDQGALVLELALLITFIVSLGTSARVFAGVWGVMLAIVAVGGVLWPLVMEVRQPGSALVRARAAMLILLGGLLLRVTVVFSSSAIHTAGTTVLR